LPGGPGISYINIKYQIKGDSMATAEQIIATLQNLGFYSFLLPWLFTFAVVYGLLVASKLFGEANKRVSAALALVLAFFVTAYSGQWMATFFSNIFGGSMIIVAGILVILLFILMVGKNPQDIAKTGTIVALVVIGIVLWILSTGAASGFGAALLLSHDLVALVLLIIVLVTAVWLITKPEKKEEEAQQQQPQEKKR
jgi:hypothetical protein